MRLTIYFYCQTSIWFTLIGLGKNNNNNIILMVINKACELTNKKYEGINEIQDCLPLNIIHTLKNSTLVNLT